MALALARFARENGSLRSGDTVATAALFSVKEGSGSADDLGSVAQGVVALSLRSDLPDTAGRRPFVLTLNRGGGLASRRRACASRGSNLDLDTASMVYPQPEVTGEPGSPLYQQAFRGKVIIAGRARSAQGAGAEPRAEVEISGLRRPSLPAAGRRRRFFSAYRNLIGPVASNGDEESSLSMTWIEIAPWLVRALGAYAALGVLFAGAFLARGIERLDPGAHGSGWGFRLIVLPGVVAFWPLLLRRWLRRRRAAGRIECPSPRGAGGAEEAAMIGGLRDGASLDLAAPRPPAAGASVLGVAPATEPAAAGAARGAGPHALPSDGGR